MFYLRNYYWARRRARRSMEKIDMSRLRDLEPQLLEENPECAWLKYFDAKLHLQLAWLHVCELGLHRSEQPRRILDIGTGAGYFPFVLQELGHDAVGADLDRFPVFNAISEALAVDRRTWEVQPFVPAPPFGGRFDMITAFALDFDRSGYQRVRWSVSEWAFFLHDMAENVLTEDGEILLGIKRYKGGEGLNAWDEELFQFFQRTGAKLPRKCRVHFTDLSRLRDGATAEAYAGRKCVSACKSAGAAAKSPGM